MDVVYVVKHGDRNEELRHSLRSLANLPHDRVWIAGYKPSWVHGVGVVPMLQTGSKWENSTANLLAACEHPEISDDFVLFNDDFFVMHPVAEIPVLHRGPVSDVVAHYTLGGESHYLTGMRETAGILRKLGHHDPLSYELHVPMTLNKGRCAQVLRLPQRHGFRVRVLHKRTLYGNHFAVGGTQMADVKVATAASEWSPEWTFLSTHPVTFANEPVGVHIRRRFRDPSPYESEEADMADDKTSRTGMWLTDDGKVVTTQPRGAATQLVRPGGRVTQAVEDRIASLDADPDAPAISAAQALGNPDVAIEPDEGVERAVTSDAGKPRRRTAKKS